MGLFWGKGPQNCYNFPYVNCVIHHMTIACVSLVLVHCIVSFATGNQGEI